ncbi:MAG: protein-glutamate O-methyltransferase CheR [Candidatus Thermoplasmatota archaeon]|nr:protein-glutamate O-methyltransferase CheR [Candidatus Thermoplasmatota archaeon]
MELTEDEFTTQVMRHLFRSRGVDLSGYSQSFVFRCIRRRIGRSGHLAYPGYLKHLMKSEEETNELLNALSINVTEFFRDKSSWDAFVKAVLRPMIERKTAGGGLLRMWSAGCATGQETYTMAICVAEELEDIPGPERPMVTVLGTDISHQALVKAKSGVYEKDQVKGLSDRMLAKYFVPVGEGYEAKDIIKKRVRYVRENLLDVPTMKYFDIIVCRNVMIYFSRKMHEVVARNLFEALRQGGYLMLGKTETLLGAPRDSFDVVDLENRILKKK